MNRRWVGFCFLMVGPFLFSSGATTLYVVKDNPGATTPYTNWAMAAGTIQTAVGVAVAGDTVLVANGNYLLSQPIAIAQNITLRGVKGRDVTTIDGGFPATTNTCLNLSAFGGATVEGFTITGGHNLNPGAGGGMTALMGGMVRNCRFIHNVGYQGGGVSMNFGGSVENCIVISNLAATSAGGVLMLMGGAVRDCEISHNVASNGLGGGLSGGAPSFPVTISNCVIRYNRVVKGQGGGVNCLSGSQVLDCIVENNSADVGGGIRAGLGVRVQNCLIRNNLALDNSGGGISIFDGGLVSNCTINGNSAAGVGGGVTAGDGAWILSCTITSNTVYSSTRGASGGGVHLSAGTAALDCRISYNRCVDAAGTDIAEGGGIAINGLTIDNTNAPALVARCEISHNSVTGLFLRAGGGLCIFSNGWVRNCLIADNAILGTVSATEEAKGGGVCLQMGQGVVSECEIVRNWTPGTGGGVHAWKGGTIRNCLIAWNSAQGAGAKEGGGGIFFEREGAAENCTVVSNTALQAGGVMCDQGGALRNTIVMFNAATQGRDNYTNIGAGWSYSHCCTEPDVPGDGNLSGNPLFVNPAAGNFRLGTNSSCINLGTNQSWMIGGTDLDGHPRISPAGGRVDIGAYEYQWGGGGSVIPAWWLEQYGLSTNGSADFTDNDTDTFNNWAEWRAGTDPTNMLSFFRFQQPGGVAPTGLVIRWPSITGRTYAIDCSTNLVALSAFWNVATNIPGRVGFTTYTNTTAVGYGPFLYRVAVEAGEQAF